MMLNFVILSSHLQKLKAEHDTPRPSEMFRAGNREYQAKIEFIEIRTKRNAVALYALCRRPNNLCPINFLMSPQGFLRLRIRLRAAIYLVQIFGRRPTE